MGKDQRLVDTPSPDRLPALRRRVARAHSSLGPGRAVMGQPELCGRKVHPSRNRSQAGVIPWIADARLIADQLVRQIHFADFGKRQRRTDIGPRFDIAER